MKKDTIKKLCCPFDKEELDLKIYVQDIEGRVTEGVLRCTKCRRVYPIVHGIPILSPDEYRQPELEQPLFRKWEAEHGKLPA